MLSIVSAILYLNRKYCFGRMDDQVSPQKIHCTGSDLQNSYPVYGTNVVVTASKVDDGATASNKMKVSQISKYDWEERYYTGNLVSCNNKYFSYVLRVRDSQRDDTVRVINQKTSERVLLKDFRKNIQDIAFESLQSDKLACVDSYGTLYVFQIYDEEDETVKSKLILEIQPKELVHGKVCRVVWAPNLLLPVDAHETMIALSIDNSAETYNIPEIIKAHGTGRYVKEDLSCGVISIQDCHQKPITCLALSPDMQVLATSSIDGDVKFWSLNLEEGATSSCLHEWDPHGGEPVTCLFFCDDHLIADDSAPFWRYLITGTSYNSVLKIWCAVNWECIQTISFSGPSDAAGENDTSLRRFKVSLDLTAKYLLLSDIQNPVLYICQLFQDVEREKTCFVSVSEFILKDPVLSFSIMSAKERKTKRSSGSIDDNKVLNGDAEDDIREMDGDDEEEEGKLKDKRLSIVTLYAIQKKALQKLTIKFNTKPSMTLPSLPTNTSPSQEDLQSVRDGLSDVELADTNISLMADGSVVENNVASEESGGSSPTLVTMEITTGSASSSLTDVTKIPSETPPSESAARKSVAVQNEERSPQLIDISDTTLPDTSIVVKERPTLESVSSELDTLQTADPAVSSVTDLTLEGMSLQNDTRTSVSTVESVQTQQSPQIPDFLPDMPSLHVNHSIEDVYFMLSKQQELINSQQRELGEMKEILKCLVNRQGSVGDTSAVETASALSDEDSREDIKVHMQLLQKSATSQFSKSSKEFNKYCSQRLEQFTKDVSSQMQTKEERVVQVLSNIVNNTIAIKLEKTLKTEIKQTVIPGLDKAIAKQFEMIDRQVAQKLSVWERTLREETSELIKSEPLAESIGSSAARILESTIPNAYLESFQNVLLPGFEKASMAMFMQINTTFQQGTKQYLEKLEQHLESKKQRQQELQGPLISNLQDLVNSFQGTADRLTSGVETNLEALMQKQLREATDRMQNTFDKTIETRIIPSLSKTISRCADDLFKDWKAKIDGSFSAIVQQHANIQSIKEDTVETKKASIIRHIKEGNYHSAFEVALSASNLSMVLFACKQIDPVELFQGSDGNDASQTIPQPIILSLIQQLSQNLLEDTEMKIKYLEESVMALNVEEHVTKEHMPGILACLSDQLKKTIDHLQKTNPSNEQIKPLRMLNMTAKALLK